MIDEMNVALIQRLKNGDHQVFQDIYTEYHLPLYSLALRYLKKDTLAEDAVQDVFLNIWYHRARIDEHLSFKGFLFTSMKNYLLNAIRKHKNEILKHTLYTQNKEVAINDTENGINYVQSQHWVEKGLNRLSTKKKEILTLSLYEGLSHREIAHKLHLSEHTVRSQISQSHKILRTYLEKVMGLLIFFTIIFPFS